MRMIQYLEEGNVPENEQVMLASNFLQGKALSFFLQKVSRNHSKWKMIDFVKGIFNFCFPINYQSQQRAKLNNCRQGNRSIMEYAYEYEMLDNLVGTASKRDMLIKFWDSMNPKIWRELHHEKMNKEINTYEEILEQAELIEMAEMEFLAPYYGERPVRNNGQNMGPSQQNGNGPCQNNNNHNLRNGQNNNGESNRPHERSFGNQS